MKNPAETQQDIGKPHIKASLWEHSISFIAERATVVEHYHHCYKIVVSLDNGFECVIDGQAYFGLHGFVVNQEIPHSCFAPDANVLVNFIETDSPLGWKLRDMLADKAWLDMDSVLPRDKFTGVLPQNYRQLTNAELIPYVNRFFDLLLTMSDSAISDSIDSRIGVAINYIEASLDGAIELVDVADKMNLSPDRARHLFVDELGIPFTQYVLWQRIRRTMQVALHEESKLTTACLRFGFTDQPHFNKIFKRIFGVPPMAIIRHCRILL